MDSNVAAIEVKEGEMEEAMEEANQEPAFDSDLLKYDETDCERSTVNACGNLCFVFLGLCALSWFVHAIPVQTITDNPPFANSLLYLSIAHHTDQWQDAQNSVSPPPPSFGDGKGNFPSV
jgi:hypothetical protein